MTSGYTVFTFLRPERCHLAVRDRSVPSRHVTAGYRAFFGRFVGHPDETFVALPLSSSVRARQAVHILVTE